MRVLFVCNQNKHRSRTAKEVFKDRLEVRSAGLYNDKPVSADLLSWADVIAVMEESQRSELVRRFPEICLSKRIICLDIPDVFSFGDERLVELLNEKFNLLLEPFV